MTGRRDSVNVLNSYYVSGKKDSFNILHQLTFRYLKSDEEKFAVIDATVLDLDLRFLYQTYHKKSWACQIYSSISLLFVKWPVM